MPIFNYKARNPRGELQTGVVDAVNAQAAADVLRTNNLVVVSLVVWRTALTT